MYINVHCIVLNTLFCISGEGSALTEVVVASDAAVVEAAPELENAAGFGASMSDLRDCCIEHEMSCCTLYCATVEHDTASRLC